MSRVHTFRYGDNDQSNGNNKDIHESQAFLVCRPRGGCQAVNERWGQHCIPLRLSSTELDEEANEKGREKDQAGGAAEFRN